MSLEKILKNSGKAMIIGIGGGGDIVGTLPTANLLEIYGVESVLGGLSWERSVFDPVPGPRKFEETLHCEKINEVVWFADKNSSTSSGVRFAESGMADVLNSKTLLVDINYGTDKTVDGILDAAEKLACDLVIGVDVGGDAIGFGHEKGLLSPLADAIMTATLYKLGSKMPTMMGIFGFGSDGELTIDELEKSFKAIASYGGILGSWGITQKTLQLMKKAIEIIPTEASRSPVEYAMGKFENTSIRSGTVNINLNLCSTITFYLDPGVVFENISRPARTVAECNTIEEASKALNGIGIRTELDLEMEKYKKLSV